jgi:hypothetical protein
VLLWNAATATLGNCGVAFRNRLEDRYTGARSTVEEKAVEDRARERVVGHLRNALNIVKGNLTRRATTAVFVENENLEGYMEETND